MTGFGQGSSQVNDIVFKVDIKSLNSKFVEVRIRIPEAYAILEVELRNLVMSAAERGKIDVNVHLSGTRSGDVSQINIPLFKMYYEQLQSALNDLQAQPEPLTGAILQLDHVVQRDHVEASEVEKQAIMQAVQQALEELTQSREREGQAIYQELLASSKNIITLLDMIEPIEIERMDQQKQKLLDRFQEFTQSNHLDLNRFEQELIYYLDKLDINEEKNRLREHCRYFEEALEEVNTRQGKKLNFIAQEMGREINTLGSKANHHVMQRHVVSMKESLEMIKEQLANVV